MWGEKEIGRLYVAVNEVFVVQCLKSGQRAQRDLDRLPDRKGAGSQAPRQRFTFEKLHRQKHVSLVVAHVEDLTEVRVIDGGSRPRFPPETFASRGVKYFRTNELQRDLSFEPLIERFVDDTHPATAKLANDPVLSEPIS